jgi:hypothetical protein
MFSRKVTAPDGRVWRVPRPWPLCSASSTRPGAYYYYYYYYYAGGMDWRERRHERERMNKAIESANSTPLSISNTAHNHTVACTSRRRARGSAK